MHFSLVLGFLHSSWSSKSSVLLPVSITSAATQENLSSKSDEIQSPQLQRLSTRKLKGALKRHEKLTWESSHSWNLLDIMHDFYIFGTIDFYTILLSFYDVIYDITSIPEGTLL